MQPATSLASSTWYSPIFSADISTETLSGIKNTTPLRKASVGPAAHAIPAHDMDGAYVVSGAAPSGTPSNNKGRRRDSKPGKDRASAGLITDTGNGNGNEDMGNNAAEANESRPLVPPRNMLPYSQAIGRPSPTGTPSGKFGMSCFFFLSLLFIVLLSGVWSSDVLSHPIVSSFHYFWVSPSQSPMLTPVVTADILHVPRQRPNIVQVASPDHNLYPTLEQAKETGWKKTKRRRSSATPGAAVVRPAIRSHHGVIDSVVPETREAEQVREQKVDIPAQVKNDHQLIVDLDLSEPIPGDDEEISHVAAQPTAQMLTVGEIEDRLFKGKQRAADSDSEDGSAVIAKLMSKLIIPPARPRSAHSVLVPSSSYSREEGTFPETSSQQRSSVDAYVAPRAPEVPTFFRPISWTSQKRTVPFSAPLESVELPRQQRIATSRDISSMQQEHLFPSSRVLSSFSQQLENPDASRAQEDQSSQFFFRYQRRPLGHNSCRSSPPLTLYQRRAVSRRERSLNDQGIGNQTAMPPTTTHPFPPRQSGLPAVPGTPTYRDVQMTPAQAETGQRIAAIWRANAQGAYSPSVYSRPANNDENSASAAAPAPPPGSSNPNSHAPTNVPISFRPSSDNNSRPGNPDTIDSTSTLGPISFNEVNNLMSLLTEHIVTQVTSSRDSVVASLASRIEALGQEVAHLKATQQHLLAQQGALLNMAHRRHHAPANSVSVPAVPGPVPPRIPARSGSTFSGHPAHRQYTPGGAGGAPATYVPPAPLPKDASPPRVRFHMPSCSFSGPRGVGRGPSGSGSVSRPGPLEPVGFGAGAVPENHWYHRAHPPAGRS